MEKTNIQWEEVNPTIWKPENQGDKLIGKLIKRNESGGKYGNESYIIENKEGQHLVFSTTVLAQRMELVNLNDLVKITYKGTVKNKKEQDIKIFKVERGTKTI